MGLGQSLFFSGLSSVLRLLIQFGLSIFVARLLTPTEIGSFGAALAAAAVVRAFESAGINNFVASHKSLGPDMMRTVFTVNGLLNLVLATILWAASGPIGAFFESPVIAQVIEVTALATLLNTHMPIIYGLLRRDMRFQALMGIELTVTIVGGITTMVAVFQGYGPLALALALVAEKLITIFMGLTLFRHRIPILPRLAEFRSVLGYGLTLSTATVIGILGKHSGNFILGKILGLAPAAQFDRAYTLPRLIWQVALPSFHNVLVPEAARRNREGGDVAAVIQDTMKLFMLGLWPAGLVIALVSPELTLLLFGHQWQPAAAITPYLVIFGLISSPITLACSALVAMGHGGAMIKIQLAENLTKVAILCAAFFFDLKMIAFLMAIPLLAYLATALHFLTKYEFLSLRLLVRAIGRPLRTTAVCTLPVIIARFIGEPGMSLGLPALLAIAGSCALLYLGCLRIWEREVLSRLLAMAGFPPNGAEMKDPAK